MTLYTGGNYLLPALVVSALIGRPGVFREITVLHDDGCRLLAGTGPCNCSPDLVVGPPTTLVPGGGRPT